METSDITQQPGVATRNGPLSPDFDILDDNGPHIASSVASSSKSTHYNNSVLGDLAVNKVHDPSRPSLESVVSGIEKLHIQSTPEKETTCARPPNNSPACKLQPCSQQSPSHLSATQDIENIPVSQRKENLLTRASRNLPSNQEQLIKHLAGQFELVLSVPAQRDPDSPSQFRDGDGHRSSRSPSGGEKFVYFGCNLVERGAASESEESGGEQNRSANSYTLLATPVDGDEESPPGAVTITREKGVLDNFGTPRTSHKSPKMTDAAGFDGTNNHQIDQVDPSPVMAADSPSRIEDSFEALDELEDQLEAINEVTHFDRAPPRQQAKPTSPPSSAPKRPGSTRAESRPSSSFDTTRSPARLGRTNSTRRTTATSANEDSDVAPESTKQKRLSVFRPASLLPPKPLAKSSKPPTLSTFELPGEAVARRLKEQREARLSMQAAEQAAASPPKPRRSSKPLTRPTFELPGEAISRRKREETEARLRAQEEEERKRREFKARPIRSSMVPSTRPRENIASRARQNKAGVAEGSGQAAPTANKRNSIATAGPSRFASHRGRSSDVRPLSTAQMSRATSSSTGSGQGSTGKRSTLSAEEAQQQKLRGKDIYSRDNSFTTDRERERRQREELAKQARQEAAERSRLLSRAWAEKQRAKKSAAA